MTRLRPLAAALGAIAVVAIAGCGGSGGSTSTTGASATTTAPAAASTTAPAQAPASGNGGGTLSIHQIYEQDGPGVAYVQAKITQKVQSPFGQQVQHGIATGSGFVVDNRGHIVTNAHVVLGGSDITVQLGHGKPVAAKVAGIDASQDLAVLQVDPSKVKLDPLPFGNSDQAIVGEPVVAIGNPFGLDNTVTSGIVSALQRQIVAPRGNIPILHVIQTDAAINPGNSGGPLIDDHGRVIGVNSQIATGGSGSDGNVGIGFAIPISTVKKELPQLEKGQVRHPYLGADVVSLSPALAHQLNLGVDHGALIQSVVKGGPAAKAGLRGGRTQLANGITIGGDVITAIDGKSVQGADDLIATLFAHKPGDHVKLTYRRDGHDHTITVTLGTRPNSGGPSSTGG